MFLTHITMRTLLFTIFAFLQMHAVIAQKQEHLIAAYLSFHVDHGLYDRTLSNNSTGFGAGLQAYLNSDKHFKPNLEINTDIFGGTKELYLTPDGKIIYAKDELLNVWLGAAYIPENNFFTGLSAGPSFSTIMHTYP